VNIIRTNDYATTEYIYKTEAFACVGAKGFVEE
jgi:hypothetical protein